MRRIKNMRELQLLQNNLKFKEQLAEKELAGSSAKILDNLTGKLKDLAFDLGTHLTMEIIALFRKSKSARSSADS
ncbi:MAG: hypothetical protein JW761_06865 [Prolixibacteraceae bacterium]|nr:hypothetical protein [Prolixibacteraceae bacterium]